MKNKRSRRRIYLPSHGDPSLEDAYILEFSEEYVEDHGPKDPFVNEYGVVIGDHDYESSHSPLEQWSTEVDPVVMSGDEWVHPYNDIGFYTRENRDLFEKGISPQAYPFMHQMMDVTYNNDFIPEKEKDEPNGN
jgi:hypothetical protein